jgi:hypothetical protein
MQRIHRGLVGGREMHAEQHRPRPFPQCYDVVLAAGAAQVDGVAVGGDILQGPDFAVELGGFLQVVDAQLDAAQAVNSGVGHGRGLRRALHDGPWAGSSTGSKEQFIANSNAGGPQSRRLLHSSQPPVLVAFATGRAQIRAKKQRRNS